VGRRREVSLGLLARRVENLPGAVPAFVALYAAQGELHGYASELRGAIEHGWPDELIALETPTHMVWVTGGPSWGEPPGDLVDATIYLAEAGITNVLGFDGYTRYDEPPIEQRTFGFSTRARLCRTRAWSLGRTGTAGDGRGAEGFHLAPQPSPEANAREGARRSSRHRIEDARRAPRRTCLPLPRWTPTRYARLSIA
jgi:hypothetical protein